MLVSMVHDLRHPSGCFRPEEKKDSFQQESLTHDEDSIRLTLKIACFVKICTLSMKGSWSELVNTRRSKVLILPLH